MSPIHQFPEELLERILAYSIASSFSEGRPAWHRSPSSRLDSRLAPLLISRQLFRIAVPLFYHTININTPTTAHLLHRTLRAIPSLASYIRNLTVAGVWADAASIMRLCGPRLRVLKITISFEGSNDRPSASNEPEKEFAQSLKALTGVQHLTLCKPNNVYLSLPRPRYIIYAVACAISAWSDLRTANMAFKLSDDTPTSPQHVSIPVFAPLGFPPTPVPPPTGSISVYPSKSPCQLLGPISALAKALASAPHLQTFVTHLPSVWNVSILTIASNPHLERIVLSTPGRFRDDVAGIASPFPVHASSGGYQPYGQVQGQPHVQGIVGTGLFLMEARRHARLSELIRAGTQIMRTRARTLESPSPTQRCSPVRKEKVDEGAVQISPVGHGMGSGVGLGICVGTEGRERGRALW